MTTAEAQAVKTRRKLVPVELQHEIEQFLYDEADLLDQWKIDDWFALLAEDLHYWAPTRTNRLVRESDREIAPPTGSAYFDEDKELMGQRITQIHTGIHWAEDPLSRTRHIISNVKITPTDNPNEFEVESSFYVFRTRLEREMDRFVGKRRDLLRRADNEYGFEIVNRTIWLDFATLLAKNISIFF